MSPSLGRDVPVEVDLKVWSNSEYGIGVYVGSLVVDDMMMCCGSGGWCVCVVLSCLGMC
jgi:hypothetical protein